MKDSHAKQHRPTSQTRKKSKTKKKHSTMLVTESSKTGKTTVVTRTLWRCGRSVPLMPTVKDRNDKRTAKSSWELGSGTSTRGLQGRGDVLFLDLGAVYTALSFIIKLYRRLF